MHLCKLGFNSSHSTYVWDSKSAISVYHSLKFRAVLVTIATKMEPKRPVGWHERSPYDVIVLPNNIVRSWTGKHVEVEDSSDCTEGQGWHWLNVNICERMKTNETNH